MAARVGPTGFPFEKAACHLSRSPPTVLLTMAAKKTPAKAPAPAKPEPFDPVHAHNLVKSLKAQHPAIHEARRKAYRARSTDPKADQAGKQTVGVDVRECAASWAVIMDETLRKYPGALEYGVPRFVWFLECFDALHAEITADENRRSPRGAVQCEADTTAKKAVEVRDALLSALKSYTGIRGPERKALVEVVGTTDTKQNLAKSLMALAALAESWLGRTGETAMILAEDSRLTKDKIDAARASASALTSKTVDASMESAAKPQDTPAIHRAEGWMLFEMKEARRLFNEANEKNPLVPKLVPSPSIVHAFGKRPSSGDKDAAMVDPGPPSMSL